MKPQHYVVKLLKSVGATHYCSKIPQVPGTHGSCADSIPVSCKFFRSTGVPAFQTFNLSNQTSLNYDQSLLSLESRWRSSALEKFTYYQVNLQTIVNSLGLKHYVPQSDTTIPKIQDFVVKRKGKISQNFVAFSAYINFTNR